MHRLSIVDAEIFALAFHAPQYPYSIFYDHREVTGVSESEQRKLVQLFWGKIRVPFQMGESRDPKGPTRICTVLRRRNFVNGARKVRQRSLLASRGPRLLRSFHREGLLQIDPRFIVIDAVRFHVITTVFGEVVPVHRVYPQMDLAMMRSLFREIEKSGDPPKSLGECGIDVDKMQERISAVLTSNSRWAFSLLDTDDFAFTDSDDQS
jgi:hypothetical protein